MRLTSRHLLIGVSVAGAVAVVGAAMTLAGRGAPGTVPPASATVEGDPPVLANDPMKPLGREEAERRAAANREDARAAVLAGRTTIADPVIATVEPLGGGTPPPPDKPVVPPRQPVPVPRVLVLPPDLQRRFDDQIALADPMPRGFAVVSFPKPPPPPPAMATTPGAGRDLPGPGVGPAPAGYLAAQPGDVVYATLDQGFSSDDPQGLPVFATLIDTRGAGLVRGTTLVRGAGMGSGGEPSTAGRGPLDGARVMGQVSYSPENASLTFTSLTLAGRTIPIQAVGVSEATARAGVAADVDHHTLERYSALFLSSLIQGVGEVGQQIAGQVRNADLYPQLGAIRYGQPSIDWTAAGMGVVRPLGSALSSAAAQGFNRPPTISAPARQGLGVIFLAPVSL